MRRWVKSVPVFLAFVALVVGVAACGGGSSSTESSGGEATESEAGGASEGGSTAGEDGGSGGKLDPGERTIGFIPSTLTSEHLSQRAEQLEKIIEPLGWNLIVADGQGNPQVMEQDMQKFVSQGVDAIFTIALGGEEIPRGLEAAKEANIPVISIVTDPTPTEVPEFAGVFADNGVQMGEIAGEYIAKERSEIPIVGERITQNYGGDSFVQGVLKVLEREGLEYTDLRDTELADVVGAMTKNAEAIVQAAPPGPLTFVDFNDIGPSLFYPVFERIGREEVAVLTRYEDPASIKLGKEGHEVLMTTTKAYEHMFKAVSALLAYWTEETPLPAPEFSEPDGKVRTVAELPKGQDSFFDFEADLEKQLEEWSAKYEFNG